MATRDELMQLAEKALARARASGAEWCDVSVGSGRHIGVKLEKTAVKEADSGRGESCSVRAYVNGAMGYATCGGHDEDRLLAAAERAAGMAKEGTPDPDFKALPQPEPADEVAGLFDPAIEALKVEDVVNLGVANLKLARRLEKDVNLSGFMSMSSSESVLVSSTGIRQSRRRTMLDAELEALINRDDDKGFYYDFDGGHLVTDCEIEELARPVIDGARRMLGARRIAPGRMPIILGPLAAEDFLEDLVAAGNAESIQRGRSYLSGRLGQAVGSPWLTMVDDARIPGGLYSGAYDGEGAPRRRVKIFDRGQFAAMLHNSYTAGKAGEANNGHGARGGGIQHTNINIDLGQRPAAELIKEVKEGIYLAISHFSPNSTTGDLSASVDFGFYISGGEIAYPIDGTMISGNMLDLASRIDAVSSDYREEPGNRLPTIRIQDVQVTGSE